MSYLKICIVPRCPNTSENQPEKLFIRVPRNAVNKERWRRALNLTKEPSTSSKHCCCEDHFNLPEDCTDWSYFCHVGKLLTLKPHVVPHLWIEEAPPTVLPPQMSSSARKRKAQYVSERSNIAKKQLFLETSVETPSFIIINDVPIIDGAAVNAPTMYAPTVPTFTSISSSTAPHCEIYDSMQSKDKRFISSSSTSTSSKFVLSTSTSSKTTSSTPTSSTSTLSTSTSTMPPSSPSSDVDVGHSIQLKGTCKTPTVFSAETTDRFYLGLPPQIYGLVRLLENWCYLSNVHILVTLKRIRFNVSYARLGLEFGMSVSNVANIFALSLPKVADAMQSYLTET